MRELKRFFSYIGEYKVPYWTILFMTLLTSAMLNLTYSYMNKLVYSPLLMLVSVSFCLVTVFISVQINKQIKNMDKGIQNKISRLTARLSDILSGFTELKMYNGSSIVYNNYHGEQI